MLEIICADYDVSINKLDAILGVYNHVFEMTVDDQLMLVNIVNFLHQQKSFVYKKVLFLSWGRLLNGYQLKRSILRLTLQEIVLKYTMGFFKIFCCIILYNKNTMNEYT